MDWKRAIRIVAMLLLRILDEDLPTAVAAASADRDAVDELAARLRNQVEA